MESRILLIFFIYKISAIISSNKNIAANALIDFASLTTVSELQSLSNIAKLLRCSENLLVYSDIEVIIKALQDPGKNGKGKTNKLKYSRIRNLAKTLLENIHCEYLNSIKDKNIHCGKTPIVSCILQFHKQTVLSECITVYYQHHVNNILYTIDGNNNITGGLRKVLKNYQNFTENKQRNVAIQ